MEFFNYFNGFPENYGYQGIVKNGPGSSSSLILDNEKGELVRTLARPGQKGVNAEKALIALRNHSEAERRRRERINGHLTSLRGLIPGTNKMDKAALLAEVINHVKELRKKATEATKGMLVPTDTDEVRVEEHQADAAGEASYTIRAFLCCDYKHELLSDLRQALETLPLKTVSAEIATLGSRMVNVFEMTGSDQGNLENSEGRELLVNSVRQALRSVLDKFYASEEFLSRNALSSKRRRVSLFNASSSSSLENFW